MIRALPLLLAFIAAPAAAEEVPFVVSAERFADAAACRAHIDGLAATARAERYDAVEGPYELVAGDVRIHMVKAEGAGHRISEHRCLAAELSARSWNHSMEADEEEFTVESVAARAEWLKKDAPKQ
ncbi:MAG TPA: hypothetical protein VGD10_04060 [Allosphingosinicella sp.]|uniref:hypothetical protein n=1 Tax=Allosphingosinicella sp. TaxID=2823234 RepID=UPI002EDB9725